MATVPGPSGRDIIVIGASAGGLQPLLELIGALPTGLAASVFVVVHTAPTHASLLPEILRRAGPLAVEAAVHGTRIAPGTIYVAVPDHHLLVQAGYIEVTRGPRENRARPAIDPLFRTAAHAYGSRVVGVLLSGMLDDGTVGVLTVQDRGGRTIVQTPAEAAHASMPASAIRQGGADYIVDAAAIAPLIVRLVQEPITPEGERAMENSAEARPAVIEQDMRRQAQNQRVGQLTVYSCPECGGPLWHIEHRHTVLRYECHVGHIYSPDVLLVQKSEELEAALWTSVRLLKEKATLSLQTAARLREAGAAELAVQIEAQTELDDRYSEVIRQQLLEASPNPIAQAYQVAKVLAAQEGFR